MPPPGSIELRELGSPVPAHTCCVSDGAIASMPIEMTRLSSNTGRQVVPLLVVFQMPPPAAATNTVLEGPGMPATSDSRPSKVAGPIVRHRKPAAVAESRVCAKALPDDMSSAEPASTKARRDNAPGIVVFSCDMCFSNFEVRSFGCAGACRLPPNLRIHRA